MTAQELDCVIDRATLDDLPAMAAIHVAGWKQVYREIMPADELKKWTLDAREQMWRDVVEQASPPIHTLVARDDHGAVLGFCSAGPSRDDSFPIKREVYAVYVTPDAQRLGIGATLFVLILQALKAEKIDHAYTWVPLGNTAAMDFFESMGGVSIGEGVSPAGIPQVAYAWRNLAELLDR